MPTDKAPKAEVRGVQEQINDLSALQRYAREIAKKDFFYNVTSPQTNEIVAALAKFKEGMGEMKTDKTAGGRYKYQSLPGLLNAISPGLAKYGCVCMQPVQSLGDTTYVITMIMHSSGQYVRSITAIPAQYLMAGKIVTTKENLQAMGGAITYTKRHSLKSILGIDADEDTDGGGATYTPRSNYNN